MSVKIEKIEEARCFLHGPDNILIGEINTNLELNHVRIQIKDQKLEGYYVIWEHYKLIISPEGRLHNWPNGFYDTMDTQLDALIN